MFCPERRLKLKIKKKTYDVHFTHVNDRMNVDPHTVPRDLLSHLKKNGTKLLEKTSIQQLIDRRVKHF